MKGTGRMGRFLNEDFLGGRLARWTGSIFFLVVGLVVVTAPPKSPADRIENTLLGGIALVFDALLLTYTITLDVQVWRLRRPQRALARYVRTLVRERRALPVPRMGPPPRIGISLVQLREIEHIVHSLALVPWGEQGERAEVSAEELSAEEGYRILQATIPQVRGVARDWDQLVWPLQTFALLPEPWCFIGVAEVLFRLAYQRVGAYSPASLHLGLLYVALAQQTEFSQPDALIIRVKLLAAGGNRPWLRRADETLMLLKQAAPDHPRLPNAEALLYEQRGMLKQALEAYERALAHPPSQQEFVRDLASKALLLHAMGQTEEALKVNEQALKVSPDDPWIWYNQALVLLDLKRYEEARRCNERALELMGSQRPETLRGGTGA